MTINCTARMPFGIPLNVSRDTASHTGREALLSYQSGRLGERQADGTTLVRYRWQTDTRTEQVFGKDTVMSAPTHEMRQAMQAAFTSAEAVANIKFVEAKPDETPHFTIQAMESNQRLAGVWSPGKEGAALALSKAHFVGATRAEYTQTALHELGHAIGLEHPNNYTNAGGGKRGACVLDARHDNTNNSVMSYNQDVGRSAVTFAPVDMAALRHLYGPPRESSAVEDVLVGTTPHRGLVTIPAQDQGRRLNIYTLNHEYDAFIDLSGKRESRIESRLREVATGLRGTLDGSAVSSSGGATLSHRSAGNGGAVSGGSAGDGRAIDSMFPPRRQAYLQFDGNGVRTVEVGGQYNELTTHTNGGTRFIVTQGETSSYRIHGRGNRIADNAENTMVMLRPGAEVTIESVRDRRIDIVAEETERTPSVRREPTQNGTRVTLSGDGDKRYEVTVPKGVEVAISHQPPQPESPHTPNIRRSEYMPDTSNMQAR